MRIDGIDGKRAPKRAYRRAFTMRRATCEPPVRLIL
jgi:hypothetical protein